MVLPGLQGIGDLSCVRDRRKVQREWHCLQVGVGAAGQAFPIE